MTVFGHSKSGAGVNGRPQYELAFGVGGRGRASLRSVEYLHDRAGKRSERGVADRALYFDGD